MANQFDDRVNICQRNSQAFEHVGALAGLAQFKDGTAGHHLTAVVNKAFQRIFEVKQARLVLIQRHHVNAKYHLHLCQRVELVEHNFAGFAALKFDNHPQAVFIGLVTQSTDAFDAFFLDQLGHLFNQPGLVHLIRQFVHHDGFTAAVFIDVNFRPGADVNLAPAGMVSVVDTFFTVDDALRREVRPGDVFHQIGNGQIRVINQRHTAANHFF